MCTRVWLGVLVPTLLGVAMPAAAQGTAQTFRELRLLVRSGETVTVTDVDGRDTRGRLVSLTDATLALAHHGREETWREADVLAIRQRRGDSLANGALIGLAAGAGSVVVAGLVANASDGDSFESAGFFLALGVYAGIGAGIGTGVDALITREYRIFERSPGRGVAVRLTPQAGRGRVGLGLGVAF